MSHYQFIDANRYQLRTHFDGGLTFDVPFGELTVPADRLEEFMAGLRGTETAGLPSDAVTVSAVPSPHHPMGDCVACGEPVTDQYVRRGLTKWEPEDTVPRFHGLRATCRAAFQPDDALALGIACGHRTCDPNECFEVTS
ncbi:hypothetical protein ACIPY6_03065 [Streptomyces sp. NPDC090054]|uniref:hypothetical protein n=1 Tax=Streptomyces sp. NPDC090054 TaxID=3365933 RepID=UPI0038197BC8